MCRMSVMRTRLCGFCWRRILLVISVRAYKRANKEAEVRIREAEARMKIEIREQVEQQKEKIHQHALAEALLTARAPGCF